MSDTTEAVSRADAAAFREAAGLPLAWDNSDGVPEPPLDALERTRRILTVRRNAEPDVALSPEIAFAPSAKVRYAMKEQVEPWACVDTFFSLWVWIGPLEKPYVRNPWGEGHWAARSLGEMVERIDFEYEGQWRRAWLGGVSPDARPRCEEVVDCCVRQVARRRREFPPTLPLSALMSATSAQKLTSLLYGRTWNHMTLTTSRLPRWLNNNAIDDFWVAWGAVVVFIGLVAVLGVGIYQHSWPLIGASVLTGLGLALVAFALVEYNLGPVWPEPDAENPAVSMNSLADVLHSRCAYTVQEMIALAAEPWPIENTGRGGNAA